MKNSLKIILAITLAVVVIILSVYVYNNTTNHKSAPVKNNGEKWKIGYYEGGPYFNYVKHFKAFVNGLINLGWIDEIEIPEFENLENAHVIWDYLSENANSEYVKFVKDAFWTGNWDDAIRESVKLNCLERLSEDEIDLILALGTRAGQDIAIEASDVPVIVMSSSDPVEAGIIKSVEDSGYDNVFARCNPDRFKEQIELFHDIFKFDRLGIAYEDTEEGRIYINLSAIEEVAKKRGFEIIKCYAKDEGLSEEEAKQEILKCYEKLSKQIDAAWIGVHRGENSKFMPEILFPTWYPEGTTGVERGVLISTSNKDFTDYGNWIAGITAQIFNGQKPRDLNQVYKHPPKLSINMKTAEIIGFEPPDGIKSATDEFYYEIEGLMDE